MKVVSTLVVSLAIISIAFGAAPKVRVDFFVMSKCPDAAEYVTDFYESVVLATGVADIMEMTMNYIATVDPQQPSGFDSKHGQTEVWGDIYELCVENMYNETWFDFSYCMYSNYDNIPTVSQNCAASLGMNFANVKQCVSSNLGKQLMTQSINVTDSLGWNPRPGSPTVYANNQCIYGYPPCQSLDPSSDAVVQFICGLYTGTKPPGCSDK